MLPADCFANSMLGDLRDARRSRSGDRGEPGRRSMFHLAAQPIVGISYREPLDTFTTNALGTALLLEAVRTRKAPPPPSWS